MAGGPHKRQRVAAPEVVDLEAPQAEETAVEVIGEDILAMATVHGDEATGGEEEEDQTANDAGGEAREEEEGGGEEEEEEDGAEAPPSTAALTPRGRLRRPREPRPRPQPQRHERVSLQSPHFHFFILFYLFSYFPWPSGYIPATQERNALHEGVNSTKDALQEGVT